uniref:Uncharacterized protein n=1 Tax=Craspedostauros australis TaxID=1486917 RepID=A0A7R9WZC2_9STRA
MNHPVSPQNLGAYAASSAVLRNSYDDDDVLEQYAERPISTKQQSVASSDPVPTVQATKQAKQPATQDAPKKHRSFKMRPGVVKRPGNYGDDEARLEAMHNKFRSVGLMEHSFRHHEQVLATWRSTMKRKDGQNEDGHDAAAETTTTATSTSTTKAAPVVAQPPPPSTLDAKLARKPSYEHRANSSSSRSHEGAVFNSSTTLTNGQGSIRRSLAASSRSSPRVVGSWSKRTGSQRQLDA